MLSKLLLRSCLLPALAALPVASFAQDVTGAGATFPAPVYAKWADAYNKATGQPAVLTLREIDFLLMVDDEARQGALRFAEQPGGPFLREPDANRIPPLLELPRLLSATERIIDDKGTDEDLRLLFAPGSSLGGARPKASVRLKDGSLAIAKFPRRDDDINVVAWEAVALALARKAGIATAAARLEDVAGKPCSS